MNADEEILFTSDCEAYTMGRVWSYQIVKIEAVGFLKPKLHSMRAFILVLVLKQTLYTI